ncbi:chemotaxis sensory transducer [Candidatus Moduliflexus flocculans]|uniref:Chemotaxis sensory transducer n=1 Tax=Candidatus Moduliflexus flocculans TaxID=1499966 RepID=A0A0S6VT71_9BACT|nr:chemotaxis sensory transducer [Candidatus Moduliflexus flocculans]
MEDLIHLPIIGLIVTLTESQMKTPLVEAMSDLIGGIFFPGRSIERSRLVELVNAILKDSRQFGSKHASNSLLENDVRRHGLQALVPPLSAVQFQIQDLLSTLREKDKRITELEDMVSRLNNERSEFISQMTLQEDQLDESRRSAQNQSQRLQHLETHLRALVETLERDSDQRIAAGNIPEDIPSIAKTLRVSLQAWQDRVIQQRQRQQSENLKLAAALQNIARGDIPEEIADEAASASDDLLWIKSAAVTLQEIYAGSASVSHTIQESMNLLFSIADELSDDAAQQMTALRDLRKTVAQISENTVTMANQTDETAKVALEIHSLTDSLLAEAEDMIAAVQESYKNIGDINELMDKSSLLALNARIIAAQAGDHGRGFAVVAEEIKELSTRTDTFVQLITERVQAITNSTATVNEGVQRIAKSMGAVQQNTDQIASGTYEYSVSTQQMTTSVEQILSRAQHSTLLAKQLASMAKRISIALEQLTSMTQFFEQHQGIESEIYRAGDTGALAAVIPGIATMQELRKKRCAAVFVNKGPVDQIQEYQMQQEAERQHLRLVIYSGENNARLSIRIVEKLITSHAIDILFWQPTNNLTFHKILHLGMQHHVLIIPFCRGGLASREQVPFQTLTQHYEEGKVAASYVPENSSVYAILGPEHLSVANIRAQGFLWNLPTSSRCVGKAHGDWTAKEASILMKSFLNEQSQGTFDVIYGINDTSAFGAIRACLAYIIHQLAQRHTLRWTPKRVIGTDVSEEMLQCLHGVQGRTVLGKLLRDAIASSDLDHAHCSLSECSDGWSVQWEHQQEAIFSIRDGQASVRAAMVTTVIIQDMVTVSHSTFCDDVGKPIGVGAMAIRHLIDCVQHPGQTPYLLFSQEQGITKETPEAIWKTRHYVLTEAHTRWRNEHVMSLSSENQFVRVSEL